MPGLFEARADAIDRMLAEFITSQREIENSTKCQSFK